jgi:hypothetical protein
MYTIHFIVRCHYSVRTPKGDGNLKWEQIYFPERPISNDRTDSHTLMLLIIADEVLESRADISLFQSPAIMPRENTRQDWVFRVRLEASSSQWASRNIYRWPKYNMHTFGLGLCGENVSDLDSEISIKCCADRGPAGQACSWNAAEKPRSSHSIGAIR